MQKPDARFFIINSTGKLILTSSISDAQKGIADGGYIWLDYCDPNKEMLFELVSQFGIHPLSIEDCLNEDQLPKLDLFPEYSFMVFNIFETTRDALQTHELDLMLGKNYLITVSHRDQNGKALLNGVDQTIERETTKIQQGPAFLMHLVIDIVVDRKFEAVEAIEEKLDLDEDRILSDPDDFNPVSLMNSRRDLMIIRKSLFHERELVGKLIRKDSPQITEMSLVYFRDIYDHLSKYYEMSESARDLVTSLMEIHLSMLSNQMAKNSNQTNMIMRRLTLITTIFMPLSLISGIGGMSEFTMMTGQQNWRAAYLILLISMVVIAAINYLLLLRMERQIREENKI